MRIDYAEISLLGGRNDNQDRVAVAVSDHAALLGVMDGMGGHADGARAAETALKVIVDAFWQAPQPLVDPLGFLHLNIGRAHEAVVAIGLDVPMDQKPRATCAVCLIQQGACYWGHVGDSRIYLLRNGAILRRTRDHSHVEFLLREGVISAEQAHGHPMRNFVECCLGGELYVPEMAISGRIPLVPNDVLIACSDGLWGGLTDDEIAPAFAPGGAPLSAELGRLAEQAIAVLGGSSDNTTAAVVRWIGNG
ncbi:MAG: PP2C family serine/threonine-protein phosphatase [Steroidobacteraceae bacterium]